MPASYAPDDLRDPAIYNDPWDLYRRLRATPGLWFDEHSGLYAIARHAEALEVSRNAARYSSAQGIRPANLVPLSIVSMDDPEHARQRRVLSRGFTPRHVRQLVPHIRDLTNSIIDEVAARGEIDFVDDLARHVPLIVIAELMGLDTELCGELGRWSDAMIGGEAAAIEEDAAAIEAAAVAFGEYTAMVSELIERRREQPGDDLLSLLTAAYDAGDISYDESIRELYDETSELSNDELLMFCVLLMVAGNETTRNAIAGGLRAFTLFPEEKARLQADPGLIDSAVEEILRFTSPVIGFTRTVTEAHDLAGTTLAAGDRVLILYQSANRDELAFDEPDRFRIDRDPNPHLAFGFGPHYCMGANLARVEIKAVYEELFRRLPDIVALDPTSAPDRANSSLVLGMHHLPAKFTPVGG